MIGLGQPAITGGLLQGGGLLDWKDRGPMDQFLTTYTRGKIQDL